MLTAGVIRTMLVIDMVVMALLALVYLRQRRLNWIGYCCWSLVAVFIPVLGPFLVISNRPGEWDPSFSLKGDVNRLVQFMRRLLPEPAPRKKLGPLERARLRRKQRGK